MNVMNFKYTNTWEEFENYCETIFQGYFNRYSKDKGGDWEYEIRRQYAFEMKFIRNKVIEDKDILKQLWLAAFMGMLAKKYDLTINVHTQSCPYILHLLNLIPYDVMEKEDLYVKYHYPYAGISLTEYEVGEKFYRTVKAEVETFFGNSGYEFLWLGQSENDNCEAKPVGIAVLSSNKSKLDYLENCGKLSDGSVCFKDEAEVSYGMMEERNLTLYYFRPIKLNTKLDKDIHEGVRIEKTEGFVCTWKDMINTGLMAPEEQLRFQYYEPKEDEMRDILASSMADIDYSQVKYEDWLEYPSEFTREDVFESLRNMVRTEKNACYWTNIIRKGQFAKEYRKCNEWDKRREEHLFCHDEVERYKAIKYLPSRWDVLTRYELYRRCIVQTKIIENREAVKYSKGTEQLIMMIDTS